MEKIAFTLYLGGLIFGVLFFGAIHTWVITIVFLAVMAASLLLMKDEMVEGEGKRCLRWVKTDLTPLFFLFFVFLILQTIPLPQGLLVMISPEAKIAGEMSLPPPSVLNPARLQGHWYALAPYTYPVRMSLIRWVVYGLFFFGLVRCLHSRKRIETAIIAIILLCSFDALYGIIQTYSGNNRIWWFKNQTYLRDVCGTYLNRNHFAGLMEMGIVLAVAYAAALGAEGERLREPAHRRRSFKKRFLEFFSGRRKELRRFLIVFAGGVLGLGLILSASRGGIVATASALLLMGLLFSLRKSERQRGRTILFLSAIALFYGLYAGLDYTIGRFNLFDLDWETRLVRAAKAVNLFDGYRFAGVGMGNFRHAYGKYQAPQDKLLYVDYAHNDYAQFLAEVGVIGVIFLLAGMGWYLMRTFRLWKQRSDPFTVCLGIAPFGALLAIAVHSWSDYNLHRPANVMVLIAVLAIGYAALHLDRHHHNRVLTNHRLITRTGAGWALLFCAAGVIIWCGVWSVRHFIAEMYCNSDINITLNLEEHPSADEAKRAMFWDPQNAAYPHKLALALMKERDGRMQKSAPDRAGSQQSNGPIIAALESAVRLNPLNAQIHVLLGWEYSYLFASSDYFTRWLPAADICMDRAAWFAGDWVQNPKLQYDMGNYWTMRSKVLGPNDPKNEANWTKAVWYYRKGMELENKKELPEQVKIHIRSFYTDKAHWQSLQ